MADLVIVGHLAIDHIFVEGITPMPTLGGTPAYAGIAASNIGSKVKVISKVGRDFPDEYLSRLSDRGLDVSGVRRIAGAKTTSFKIAYNGLQRRMTLLDACEPIYQEDMPSDLKGDCILMGPIANEIPTETCRFLSGFTKCLSLDPQGYLRRFEPEGLVINEGNISPEILKLVHVLKASEQELYLMTGIDNMIDAYKLIRSMGPSLLIITRGSLGTVVFWNEEAIKIPSWPSRVVDPTGAGDAFFGAFLSEYIEDKSIDWCSCMGAASASFVVEGYGPSRFGSCEEVRQRAIILMKDVNKLEI